MLLLRWIASFELDAVRPGRPWLGHHHAQQRFVRYIMRRPVLDTLRRHNVLAMTNGQLSLPFSRIVRLPYTLLVSAATPAATLVPRPMRLFPPVVQLLLGILEHLLAPQIEEVIRIRVELQPVLTVLPVNVKFIKRWRCVALMVGFQHRRWHGVPGDNLLVEHHRTLERFPHMYILQRNFFDVAVELSDFHSQSVYPGLQGVRSVAQSVGLPRELAEQILGVPRQTGQLPDGVGQGAIRYSL